MHALEEYGVMQVKLYEDIARYGHIATTYAYPVKVNDRYVMDPSPIPKFDNPKMHMMPALQLFGAGRENASMPCRRSPRWRARTSTTIRSACSSGTNPARCAARATATDEVVLDDQGNRMFVCSDTDYCRQQLAQSSQEAQH